MNLISELATEALVSALGWTLLHSLWQGALVALTLSLLLVLLQRHAATLRYFMAAGAMLLQLLISGATFTYYYSNTPSETIAVKSTASTTYYSESIATLSGTATDWSEPLTMAQLYFEQHLPLLVTLWLLGLLVMALRFMGGLAYTQRLKYQHSGTLGDKWQAALQTIATQIGVKQAVQLAESALVKVPMVIGFAKPVILLPIGAVAGLSTAQVEAILAHELAHIRRNDYLVNLLQSIVDILFFYHPAMWWMTSVVREERENCCDDMAVAVCGNSLVYARALAILAQVQLPQTPELAMALAGKKGSLLSRIKRLVEQPSLRPSFSEGFMAALVVVVGVLFLSAGAMAGMKDNSDVETEFSPLNETIVEKKAEVILPEIETEEDLLAYTFELQDTTGRKQDIVIIKNKKGEVTELYVNGKQIPKKDIPEYNALINERLEAVKHAPKASRVEVEREIRVEREAVNEARRENRKEYRYEFRNGTGRNDLLVPPPPAPPAPRIPHAPGVPAPPHAPMAPMVPPAPPIMPLDLDGTNKEEAKKQQKEYERAMKEYEKDMKRFQEDMKQRALEMEARGRESNEEIQQLRHEQGMRQHELSMKRHEESMKRHEENMKRHEEMSVVLDNVNKELVKDGLLKKNAEKIDFKIDNTGLYIDGKKQPQEVYNKYRGMMKTKEGKPFNYTYKKDGKNKNVILND